MLPLKPMKEALRQECNGHHISQEAAWALKEIMEDLMKRISFQAAREFEQLNRQRMRQGLPPLKRLNAWAVRNALKPVHDIVLGSQSSGVVSLGGEEMSTQANTTKSAKEACSDDGGADGF